MELENILLTPDVLRGHTELIVLSILKGKERYGLEIHNEIERKLGGKAKLKEITLYAAYKRLEKAKCIESYWGDETSGARRKYYRITKAGLEKLTSMRKDFYESFKLLEMLIK